MIILIGGCLPPNPREYFYNDDDIFLKEAPL